MLEFNPYNTCEFPLRLSCSDANFSEKVQLIRHFHQFDSTRIQVTRDFDCTNSRVLMSFYRLCVADAIELDKIKFRLISKYEAADVEQKVPLSFLGSRNELAALRIIGTIANDQLRANFPTSIDQDYKYLTVTRYQQQQRFLWPVKGPTIRRLSLQSSWHEARRIPCTLQPQPLHPGVCKASYCAP
jgi:hypothetical protein